MDSYSVQMKGVEVKVKVLHDDWDSHLNKYINDMRTAALSSNPRVVGFDFKRFDYAKLDSRRNVRKTEGSSALVLCRGPANCLIIHLSQTNQSAAKENQVLMKFLNDANICFVGHTRWPWAVPQGWGVGAGTLAARVLQKPVLSESSLWKISQEVGVHYDGPTCGTYEITVDSWADPLVLTPDQVKLAITDAYAHYNIGYKLLNSL